MEPDDGQVDRRLCHWLSKHQLCERDRTCALPGRGRPAEKSAASRSRKPGWLRFTPRVDIVSRQVSSTTGHASALSWLDSPPSSAGSRRRNCGAPPPDNARRPNHRQLHGLTYRASGPRAVDDRVRFALCGPPDGRAELAKLPAPAQGRSGSGVMGSVVERCNDVSSASKRSLFGQPRHVSPRLG